MKISREIMNNSIEIELTGIEIERTYNEYIERHDKDEVIRQLKDMDYENLDNIPEEIIADLASQVRERIEEYRDQAIIKLIHQNEELLAQYKEKWKIFRKKVTVTAEHEYTIKAKSAEEAEAIFETWSERKSSQITSDICEDVEYNGDWEWGEDVEEDEYGDPEDVDIDGEEF